jgi:hypothetical protein
MSEYSYDSIYTKEEKDYKLTLCSYYEKGYCKKSNYECSFAHGKSDLRCSYGLNCYKKCNRVHYINNNQFIKYEIYLKLLKKYEKIDNNNYNSKITIMENNINDCKKEIEKLNNIIKHIITTTNGVICEDDTIDDQNGSKAQWVLPLSLADQGDFSRRNHSINDSIKHYI